MISSIRDTFLTDNEFLPIAEVNLVGEEKSVVIVGIAKGISNEKAWYYDGCNVCKYKCEKKLTTIEKEDNTCDVSETNVYMCTNPECVAKDVKRIYRFKIPVILQDESGSITITVFNRGACKLLKKTAKEVVRRQEKNEEVESDALSLGEIQNNVVVCVKSDVSSIGENVTPLSRLDEVDGKGKTIDLKRNLEDVYDDEEASGISGIKAVSAGDVAEGSGGRKFKLLIPKKEK